MLLSTVDGSRRQRWNFEQGRSDGLTQRVIAWELHVTLPALYWHFKDKQALLDEGAATSGPA